MLHSPCIVYVKQPISRETGARARGGKMPSTGTPSASSSGPPLDVEHRLQGARLASQSRSRVGEGGGRRSVSSDRQGPRDRPPADRTPNRLTVERGGLRRRRNAMGNLEEHLAGSRSTDGLAKGGSMKVKDDLAQGGSMKGKDGLAKGGSMKVKDGLAKGGSMKVKDGLAKGGSMKVKDGSPKGGSMKVKKTPASTKPLHKSTSSGCLKKRSGPSSPRHSTTSDLHHCQSASGKMEMLTQKQNGSVGESSETELESQEEKKEHTATIKGLWKKAFKSLKSGSEPKWTKKSSLRRKDSKESEELEPQETKEIDPVYSLLKCAADLPKRAKDSGQPTTPPCTALLLSRHGDSSGSTSKASSPSSSGRVELSADGTCLLCGGVHPIVTPPATPSSLGHDLKVFHKPTTPTRRQSSNDPSI